MKRLGIFGGAFNPVHSAHLLIIDIFIDKLALDCCICVPTWVSPFKRENTEQAASPEHRLNMLKLAIEGKTKIEIDDFEIRKQGISYTIDTVRHYREKYFDAEIFLLVGSDNALNFNHWKDYREILELVTLCIANRSPLNNSDIEKIKGFAVYSHNSPVFLENPIYELSSTIVRDRIKQGKSLENLVPDKVRQYIEKEHLYRT
jgi:nicotinate-nucleotide adenylyltransferase